MKKLKANDLKLNVVGQLNVLQLKDVYHLENYSQEESVLDDIGYRAYNVSNFGCEFIKNEFEARYLAFDMNELKMYFTEDQLDPEDNFTDNFMHDYDGYYHDFVIDGEIEESDLEFVHLYIISKNEMLWKFDHDNKWLKLVFNPCEFKMSAHILSNIEES